MNILQNGTDLHAAVDCCSLFCNAKSESINYLFSHERLIFKRFKKKEFIINIEESHPFVGIVVSGSVEVQLPLSSGGVVSLVHKNQGDLFGGAVAFSKNSKYPCDIYAKEDGSAVFIHRDTILEICLNDRQILENLVTLFAGSVIGSLKRTELFSYSSVKQKIALYLLDPVITSERKKIVLPFSKSTWAKYLNVSRPTLMRELNLLSGSGLLRISGRSITIEDREGLLSVLMG